MQFNSGVSYLTIFGVVISMEAGFCKFVDVCSNDLEMICNRINGENRKDKKFTERTLKEAIELHQEILKWVIALIFRSKSL